MFKLYLFSKLKHTFIFPILLFFSTKLLPVLPRIPFNLDITQPGTQFQNVFSRACCDRIRGDGFQLEERDLS